METAATNPRALGEEYAHRLDIRPRVEASLSVALHRMNARETEL
jgi:hypothetical protein